MRSGDEPFSGSSADSGARTSAAERRTAGSRNRTNLGGSRIGPRRETAAEPSIRTVVVTLPP